MILGPHRAYDLDCVPQLVHTNSYRWKRYAVRLVLGLVPARAKSQHHPPAANMVECRSHLRQQGRIAESDGTDKCSERYLLHSLGQSAERHPRVHARLPVRLFVSSHEVVADDDAVKPGLLSLPRHLPDSIVAYPQVILDLNTELQVYFSEFRNPLSWYLSA